MKSSLLNCTPTPPSDKNNDFENLNLLRQAKRQARTAVAIVSNAMEKKKPKPKLVDTPKESQAGYSEFTRALWHHYWTCSIHKKDIEMVGNVCSYGKIFVGPYFWFSN